MTTNPEAGMRLEDAAQALFRRAQGIYREDHDHFPLKHSWETLNEKLRDGWRSMARVAIEAAAPVAPAGSEGETGWLIESWNSKTGEFGATWWSLDDSLEDAQGWTKDSTIALRFARKADAQAYIDNTAWTEAKPTEHRWHEALAALAASGEK